MLYSDMIIMRGVVNRGLGANPEVRDKGPKRARTGHSELDIIDVLS
jgi:hypothetical protein